MSMNVIESAAIEWAKAHAHRFNDAQSFGKAVTEVYTAAKAAMSKPVTGAVFSADPLSSGETCTELPQSSEPIRCSSAGPCTPPLAGAEGSN